MFHSGLIYLTEDASHDAVIELINEEAFGPGRHTRAAARIREQGPHDLALSFICTDNGETIASVRMTPVMAGSVRGHLLGPLAVRPSWKNQGIGRHILRLGVEAALKAAAGTVRYRYETPLGFTTAGKIASIRFQEGDRVVPGALIAALDGGRPAFAALDVTRTEPLPPTVEDPNDMNQERREVRLLLAGTYEFGLTVVNAAGFESCEESIVEVVSSPSERLLIEH